MDPAAAVPTWCVVRAGEHSWRLPAADVLDIVFWPRLTPVPLQPHGNRPELLGVFQWQQTVLPVLQIADMAPEERRRVVIVRGHAAGRDVPLGIAAREAAVTDDPVAADLPALPELTANLLVRRR